MGTQCVCGGRCAGSFGRLQPTASLMRLIAASMCRLRLSLGLKPLKVGPEAPAELVKDEAKEKKEQEAAAQEIAERIAQ